VLSHKCLVLRFSEVDPQQRFLLRGEALCMLMGCANQRSACLLPVDLP
jgi:hypothetical protein